MRGEQVHVVALSTARDKRAPALDPAVEVPRLHKRCQVRRGLPTIPGMNVLAPQLFPTYTRGCDIATAQYTTPLTSGLP